VELVCQLGARASASEVFVDGSNEARAVADVLEDAGASEVQTVGGQERHGIAPILILVSTGAGPTAVADLVIRWRKAHLWQEIIDARGDKMRVSKDSSIKDGRIIVVSADDQKVEIHDVSGGIDVTRVREAALKSGADAVKAAADAAGRKASSPQPAAPEPAGGS
jgi:hypothetical protein